VPVTINGERASGPHRLHATTSTARPSARSRDGHGGPFGPRRQLLLQLNKEKIHVVSFLLGPLRDHKRPIAEGQTKEAHH
jgi:hypothetical protein